MKWRGDKKHYFTQYFDNAVYLADTRYNGTDTRPIGALSILGREGVTGSQPNNWGGRVVALKYDGAVNDRVLTSQGTAGIEGEEGFTWNNTFGTLGIAGKATGWGNTLDIDNSGHYLLGVACDISHSTEYGNHTWYGVKIDHERDGSAVQTTANVKGFTFQSDLTGTNKTTSTSEKCYATWSQLNSENNHVDTTKTWQIGHYTRIDCDGTPSLGMGYYIRCTDVGGGRPESAIGFCSGTDVGDGSCDSVDILLGSPFHIDGSNVNQPYTYGDYAYIKKLANGGMEIKTSDKDSDLAHMNIDVDGVLTLKQKGVAHIAAPPNCYNTTTIKVMYSEFIGNNDGGQAFVYDDDAGKMAISISDAANDLSTIVKIPEGYSVTHVHFYTDTALTSACAVRSFNYTNGDVGTTTTGATPNAWVFNSNTNYQLVGSGGAYPLACNATADLFIGISLGNTARRLYGATITIANT